MIGSRYLIKKEFKKGERISVVRSFFDSNTIKFSNFLPEDFERINGTIQQDFPATKRLSIKWDVDESVTNVRYNDVQIECDALPYQVLPGCSKDGEVKKLFQDSNSTDFAIDTENEDKISLVKTNTTENSDEDCPKLLPNLTESETDLISDEECKISKPVKKKKKVLSKKKVIKVKLNTPLPKKKAKIDMEETSSDSSESDEENIDGPEAEPESSKAASNVNDELMFKVVDQFGLDPRLSSLNNINIRSPRINNMPLPKAAKAIDHFLLYLPLEFIKDNILVSTNKKGNEIFGENWDELELAEFIHYVAILYSMQIVQLPEREMYYWSTAASGIFPAFNYGKHMVYHRFNKVTRSFDISYSKNQLHAPRKMKPEEDDTINTILMLISACNLRFQKAVMFLSLDESIMKGYHKNPQEKSESDVNQGR